MGQLQLCCVLLVMFLNAIVVTAHHTRYIIPLPQQSKDGSILQPTDASYAEALAFAQFLESKGILVKSIHLSKLNGFFQGLHKAAFFKTNKGVVQVIFFPEPDGAENVQVTEQRKDGRYLYSFSGQPCPNAGDWFDSSQPMYFQMHRTWFMVIEGKEFSDALKEIFNES